MSHRRAPKKRYEFELADVVDFTPSIGGLVCWVQLKDGRQVTLTAQAAFQFYEDLARSQGTTVAQLQAKSRSIPLPFDPAEVVGYLAFNAENEPYFGGTSAALSCALYPEDPGPHGSDVTLPVTFEQLARVYRQQTVRIGPPPGAKDQSLRVWLERWGPWQNRLMLLLHLEHRP